jgi:hypothetical protein
MEPGMGPGLVTACCPTAETCDACGRTECEAHTGDMLAGCDGERLCADCHAELCRSDCFEDPDAARDLALDLEDACVT